MILTLEDGTTIEGQSFGANVESSGEVVFNTGMVGYPETLTDPSYRGQILVLTYPLIGNYGISEKSKIKNKKLKILSLFESEKVQIAGLIVSEYCEQYSHPSAKQSLGEWLNSYNVPAISGVDTRALTQKLREKGTMLGRISSKLKVKSEKLMFDDPNKRNLVAEVSCTKAIIYEPQTPDSRLRTSILLYDCGVKFNIIRSLLNRGCRVIRVPWNQELGIKNKELRINEHKIAGIVLSNGPGDPMKCDQTIAEIQKLLIPNSSFPIPILGICLGNQLLALATGAKTYKLKYGHRGQNQPVIENLKKLSKAYITSQNHGYAVDAKTLPEDWDVWFTNLNDETVEGIRHKTKPWMSVQFHPEATPGPTDTEWIFDEWLNILNKK